ncbi:protein FAM136A [Octopus sinensis]|uniref:Protein FAM136A n=1 Tax=Octopus sinensis TaxID=2607531 RepID=A0A6P7TQ61_9MOLL|nr:protein FAM136A [Octopus sinensis]
MEDIQARVQNAVNSMITQLDQECLRKMQGDMYRCGANCCDNVNSNMEDVHRCIDRCSEPVNRAQSLIQNEIQMFQDRLQRCALDCKDQVRDRMNPTATDMTQYRGELESCVRKCSETHINLIPTLMKRIRETIAVQSK